MSSKTNNLEKKVLSFLAVRSQGEISSYLDRIIPELWSKENRKALGVLREYAILESPEGTALDSLFGKLKASQAAEIANHFVPLHAGEKAVDKLSTIQQQEMLQSKLKELQSKPLTEIQDGLSELLKQPISAFKPRSLGDTSKQRQNERKLERTAPSTGYRDLDRYIKGFIPGHIYVLSGNTNAGKTTMCVNFAYRTAEQGKRVLYFALEPENTIVEYIASVRLRKRFADLTDDDIFWDTDNIDVFGKDQIRNIEDLVRAVQSLHRYDLIIVDHIGYFTGGTSNTVAKQSDVMKDLASLAKSKQCAVMLIQHMNKGKVDKSSPENNITGSAAFKQDATDVLIMHRDTDEDEYGAQHNLPTGAILVRKSKSDMPQGTVPIRFVNKTAIIEDGYDQARYF